MTQDTKRETPDSLLIKSDAARILGITPAAVVFLERKGLLTAIRTKGGVRLFNESDVRELATKRNLERAKHQVASRDVLKTESDSIRPLTRTERGR
ncbi:MAG TPA: MerR family DNA-binding transcriptional regulator [Candidatus Limnocylindria bacterium]|nr:MerR family DNA-binding transcriptional regulator [Candidatus Limnocylindria bacterium]